MEQTKLDKTNLERIAKNPPAQRQDFKTDLTGVYLRVGPRSMAVRVTRQIDGQQSWGSIKLNPNALPSLPVLKRKIAEIQTGRVEDKPTQYPISKLSAAFFESQTSLAAGTVDNYQRSFDHVHLQPLLPPSPTVRLWGCSILAIPLLQAPTKGSLPAFVAE